MHQTVAREESLARVGAVVRRGRSLKLDGVLPANHALEEIPVGRPGKDTGGPFQERRIRALMVRGSSLSGEGLSPGDQLLIEETDHPKPGALLLAKIGGTYVLRPRPELLSDAGSQVQVSGVLIGIIRRRGFAGVATTPRPRENSASGPNKIRILRGQLGMLESTCANTRNPRLRDALRNEADRVRKQLQCGASLNKLI
jgi:hypothetical protein